MKIAVVLFLVAGPFVVWGQKRADSLFFGWRPQKIELRSLPQVEPNVVLLPFDRNTVLLPPDGMPCLIPRRPMDRMIVKTRFCCGVDRMPNALRPGEWAVLAELPGR